MGTFRDHFSTTSVEEYSKSGCGGASIYTSSYTRVRTCHNTPLSHRVSTNQNRKRQIRYHELSPFHHHLLVHRHHCYPHHRLLLHFYSILVFLHWFAYLLFASFEDILPDYGKVTAGSQKSVSSGQDLSLPRTKICRPGVF